MCVEASSAGPPFKIHTAPHSCSRGRRGIAVTNNSSFGILYNPRACRRWYVVMRLPFRTRNHHLPSIPAAPGRCRCSGNLQVEPFAGGRDTHRLPRNMPTINTPASTASALAMKLFFPSSDLPFTPSVFFSLFPLVNPRGCCEKDPLRRFTQSKISFREKFRETCSLSKHSSSS